MENIKIKNAYLITDKGVKRRDITLRAGQIDLSGSKVSIDRTLNMRGKFVLPGFVDIHMHGYDLFNFTFGLYNPQTGTYDNNPAAYQGCFNKLRKKLAEFGVTGFYIASLAAPLETLKHCYNCLSDYLGKPDGTAGARLLGAILEGPFISLERAGAMNPSLILEPSIETFEQIDDRGTIKLANIVPDSGEKSCKLTEYLTSKGIVVGAGHTSATFNQMANAVKAGLKYCIHFTNQTGGTYKPFEGGGAIEAGLVFDQLYVELILDGYHISPAYVRDIIERKGLEKIIGITDCSFAAGSSIERFKSGGVTGRFSDDRKYIAVEGKKDTLYGSNLTMNRAFKNILNWLTTNMEGIWNRSHPALGFEEALIGATCICSGNACQLTGLKDKGFGQIIDGAKANITVIDISGSQGSYKVQVELTIVDGKVVYSRP